MLKQSDSLLASFDFNSWLEALPLANYQPIINPELAIELLISIFIQGTCTILVML